MYIERLLFFAKIKLFYYQKKKSGDENYAEPR